MVDQSGLNKIVRFSQLIAKAQWIDTLTPVYHANIAMHHARIIPFAIAITLCLGVSAIVVRAANFNDLDSNANGRIDIYDFSNVIARLGRSRTLDDLAMVTNRFNYPVPSPTPTGPSPTNGPSPTQGPLKTKKWHPGHYIRFDYATPAQVKEWFDANGASPEIEGVRVRIGWKFFEPTQNDYRPEKLDAYFDAMPAGKHLIVSFDERHMRAGLTCATQNNIPSYIVNHSQFPAS